MTAVLKELHLHWLLVSFSIDFKVLLPVFEALHDLKAPLTSRDLISTGTDLLQIPSV